MPIIVLVGCGGSLDQRSSDILAGAARVEVFRIDGKSDQKPSKASEKRIDGFLVIAQGRDQGKDFAAKLRAVLSDRGTYSDKFAKCFWPGVAFRAWKGDQSLDVLICFKCDNLYCGPQADSVRETASFFGSQGRAKLVELAKEAFPNDKDIQSLPSEHPSDGK